MREGSLHGIALDSNCTIAMEAMIHDESHMIRIDWSRLMDLITDVSSHGMKRPRKGGMSLEFMCVCFMMFARSVSPCQEVQSRPFASHHCTIAVLHHGGDDS